MKSMYAVLLLTGAVVCSVAVAANTPAKVNFVQGDNKIDVMIGSSSQDIRLCTAF